MTSDDYVERIGSLIESGRFEEALALAEAHGRGVAPKLSPERFFDLCGLLEIAQRAADCIEAPRPADQTPNGSPVAGRPIPSSTKSRRPPAAAEARRPQGG